MSDITCRTGKSKVLVPLASPKHRRLLEGASSVCGQARADLLDLLLAQLQKSSNKLLLHVSDRNFSTQHASCLLLGDLKIFCISKLLTNSLIPDETH